MSYTVLFSETPNGAISSDRFSEEIRGSAITIALDSVVVFADRAVVSFKDVLTAPEEALLHTLATTHSGAALADAKPASEEDGRLIVTTFPAMLGANTVFTGRGDNLGTGEIGKGDPIRLLWDGVEARGPKSKDVRFLEPIELHDGAAYYQGGWTTEDTLTVAMVIPLTPVTPNATNTGNARRVPASAFHDVFIPAAGDGDVDVNLALAVPVPTPNGDGFWDVHKPTGAVSPSATPGRSAWHLMSVGISANVINEIPLGALTGIFDIDVYRAEYIHHAWTLRVTVNKQSVGAGEFAGWFLTYRKNYPS